MDEEETSEMRGLCECGCGGQAPIARMTNRKWGHVAGQPMRFIRGHATRKKVRWVEEDRGHKTPCWIWQLNVTHEGYPRMWANEHGSCQLAHRVLWERERGPIPEGLQLDHLCGVPSCVNLDHLEPVTGAENSRRSSSAKLSRDDVNAIRIALEAGETTTALAAQYEVCQATVGHIASGRNWRDD